MNERVGVLALLEARPERAQDVESFLASAVTHARAEARTIRWYALRIDATRFAVFDTFAGEDGRTEHVAGRIARELFAQADALFAKPPQVEFVDVLAAK
jgi:quinol monooxygenase YgiN